MQSECITEGILKLLVDSFIDFNLKSNVTSNYSDLNVTVILDIISVCCTIESHIIKVKILCGLKSSSGVKSQCSVLPSCRSFTFTSSPAGHRGDPPHAV